MMLQPLLASYSTVRPFLVTPHKGSCVPRTPRSLYDEELPAPILVHEWYRDPVAMLKVGGRGQGTLGVEASR